MAKIIFMHQRQMTDEFPSVIQNFAGFRKTLKLDLIGIISPFHSQEPHSDVIYKNIRISELEGESGIEL